MTFKGVVLIDVYFETNDSFDVRCDSVRSNICDEIVPEFWIPDSLKHLKPLSNSGSY